MPDRRTIPRRTVLAGLGMTSLSGCAGVLSPSEQTPQPTPTPLPDRDGDGIRDSLDDYPEEYLKAHRVTHIEETITLGPDEYETYRIDVPSDGHILFYDILLSGDRGVDVFLMNRDQYLNYEEGNEFEYQPPYSLLNIGDGILEKPINEGRYVLAVDYTNYETDYGLQPVEVDIVIDLAKPAG